MKLIFYLCFLKSFLKLGILIAIAQLWENYLVFRDVGNRYTGKSIGEITYGSECKYKRFQLMTAQRYLKQRKQRTTNITERLASGSKINSERWRCGPTNL